MALQARRGKKVSRQLRIPARTILLVWASAVFLAFLSSGCWGKREIEERAFIHVMGIDKGELERIHVTVLIAVPRQTGSDSMEGGSEAGTGIILSAEGWDIFDALSRIESISSRELTGMHLSCVILGEDFAKDDVALVMDVFSRSIEFRPNSFIAVCRGNAGAFIKKAKTPEEVVLSDYLTKLITSTHEHLGFCPMVTIHDFAMAYQTVESSPWSPLMELAATTPAETTESGEAAPHAATPDVQPVLIAGSALFSLDGDRYRMAGELTPEETRAALVMSGDSKGWYVDVQAPGEREVMSLVIRHTSTITHIDRQGDTVTAHFKVSLSGTIEEFVVNPEAPQTTNQMRLAIAQTVQQRIQELCTRSLDKMKALRSDAIALGRSVHGTFLTLPEWEAFDWPSKFPHVAATFDVKVDIFSTGFRFQRASPR
jgi:spore germination protein KC